MSSSTYPILLKLSERDVWTVADAYEGTIVFGGNGAGKTSGSGKDIAKAFLKQGFGGLVLTVKIDEAARWCNYVHECGRAADLITVEPGHPAALNFLEYEAARPGLGAGLTYELVRILQIAMDGGRERGQSENPYWDDAVAQLLTNAIDLVLMATGRVSLPDIVDAIRTAPLSAADAATLGYDAERRERLRTELGTVWADDSRCAQLLGEAWHKTRGTDRVHAPAAGR